MSETVTIEVDAETMAGLDRFRVDDEDDEAVVRRTINFADVLLRCEYITAQTKDRAQRIAVPFPDVDTVSRDVIDEYPTDPPAESIVFLTNSGRSSPSRRSVVRHCLGKASVTAVGEPTARWSTLIAFSRIRSVRMLSQQHQAASPPVVHG
jgi:hypothetical protein